MSETAETPPVMSSLRIVEECVEFARQSGLFASQREQTPPEDRRTTPRMLLAHHLVYSAHSTLSEDSTKAAHMLDVSLGGAGLLCRETLADGMELHVRLPLLDGSTGWVKGGVVYCRPDAEHYRVGIAFILD